MTSRFESKVVIGTGVEAGIGAASACGFHAERGAVKPLNEVLVELPAEWYRDWHANEHGPAVSLSLQRA